MSAESPATIGLLLAKCQWTYTTRKYGTLRVLRDPPMPVFANLVVTSAAPMPARYQPGDPRPQTGHAVRIKSGGYLQITRVSADYLG